MSDKTLINVRKINYKNEEQYRVMDLSKIPSVVLFNMYEHLIEIGCFAVLVDNKYIFTEVSSIFHLDIKYCEKYTFSGDL